MIYLIFAILCSTSLNVIFKLSEKNGSNRLAVTLFNFAGASLISLVAVGRSAASDPGWLSAFFSGFSGLIPLTSSILALLLGFLNGFLYFGAFYVLQLSTSRNGSAMTATFNKLGVMVPAILSVIFFHEIPRPLQIVGVLVALLAILIIYLKKEENSVITLKLALFATFFFGGFADFTSKVFQVYGLEKYQSMFLFFTFFFSLLITGVFMLAKDRRIKPTDIIFGLISGVPSQLISLFLLHALSTVPAFVLFPLYSVGVILVVNIINLIFFKEKLTVRQFAAIGLIVAAVVLLNL
ncbi:MAG: EamA family transporter [Pseudomonadota bacterium]